MDWFGLGLTVLISMAISLLSFIAILPSKIGQKILDHHFEARIAALKHNHNQEIEQLRSELDYLKDRGILRNEREFKAITDVWESFVDAFHAASQCVVQFTSYPDLTKLNDDEIVEFLESEDIKGTLVKSIINAKDKNEAFRYAKRSGYIYAAGEKILATHILLQKQSIFMPPELGDKFKAIISDLSAAKAEQYLVLIGRFGGPNDIQKSLKIIGEQGKDLFLEICQVARRQLIRALDSKKPIP